MTAIRKPSFTPNEMYLVGDALLKAASIMDRDHTKYPTAGYDQKAAAFRTLFQRVGDYLDARSKK